MYAKAFGLLAGVTATCFLACTTEPGSGQLGPTPGSIPEPEISIELPLEPDVAPSYAPVQACLLSGAKSCLELDPRPFEHCLVAGKSCEREGVRAIPIAPAASAELDSVGSRQSRLPQHHMHL